MKEADTSGLKCLQILFGRFRHSVNFPALMTSDTLERYQKDPGSELMRLAEGQRLQPERIQSSEVFRDYTGPALLRLKNGSWILLFNAHQIPGGGNVLIVNPGLGMKTGCCFTV